MNWPLTSKHKQGLCRLHILASALIAFILGISYGCGECARAREVEEGVLSVAVFVCGAVRFHTDGGSVSTGLYSPSY